MPKTVPPLFFAFSNWFGFLWQPPKVSGYVNLAPRKHFFHKGPIPIGKCNKKWWDSFLHISLGQNSLPGSCVETTVKWHHLFYLCRWFEISRDFWVKIAFSGTVADLLSAKNNRLYSLNRVDGFWLSKGLLQLYYIQYLLVGKNFTKNYK